MPGLTGIQLQELLAATGRRMSIVFVTGHADVPTSVKAMKAGAVDLLTKAGRRPGSPCRDSAGGDEGRARSGQRGPPRGGPAARRQADPAGDRGVRLGRDGHVKHKQIGAALSINEKPVKGHRARVMEKMQAGSVAELVRLADEAGVTVPAT